MMTQLNVERAIVLMREAQLELDSAGLAAAAAHLETALGVVEGELARITAPVSQTH